MGLLDRLREWWPRRRRRAGLEAMDPETIRTLVQNSLEETEATSEMVERAQDAHDRARDLMRQGHYEEALGRFQESAEAWAEQARVCRERGFKNLWPAKPEQVGREMEDLRINYLDLTDLSSFDHLASRARLRRRQLARVLELIRSEGGTAESQIYAAFPDHQREEIRSVLYHAQRRGWLVRGGPADHYRFEASDGAPDLGPPRE